MNLIKVKDVVIDFDKVVGFEPGLFNSSIDIYFSGACKVFCLYVSVSEFCDLLKFYNIDIKELK